MFDTNFIGQHDNEKNCAYDAFGNELHVNDKVAVAVSRWTGDYVMCKGIVTGWTKSRVKIKITEGAINSVKPADVKLWKNYCNERLYDGEAPRIMDKILKLS